MVDKIRTEWWGSQLDNVMTEIARQAVICDVKLLDPGVIEAVLHNDATACGSTNPIAFKKMRDMLMMGFVVKEKAFDRLGAAEADAIVKELRAALEKRLGGKLGGG
jgi:hypothetical protein